MAGGGLNRERWLAEHSDDAPGALRAQAMAYLAAQPPGGAEADPAPALAAAARSALSTVLSHPSGDRSVALDLLTADALVTLALLARAERDPAGLADFAAALRRGAP